VDATDIRWFGVVKGVPRILSGSQSASALVRNPVMSHRS
jgi:hypothetical protein